LAIYVGMGYSSRIVLAHTHIEHTHIELAHIEHRPTPTSTLSTVPKTFPSRLHDWIVRGGRVQCVCKVMLRNTPYLHGIHANVDARVAHLLF
jgi:hypothetical protein